MYKARFSLDIIDEAKGVITSFAGYTTGESWNGWATPYFTRDEAKRLVNALNEANEDTATPFAWYDVDTDAFVTVYKNDQSGVDTWKAYHIMVDGEVLALYGIGAYSWTWNLVLEQPKAIVALRKCDDDVADPWIIYGEDFVASASDNPSHPHGVWGLLTELTHGKEANMLGDPVEWNDLPFTLRNFLFYFFVETESEETTWNTNWIN